MIVIDVETTGTNIEQHGLVSIGAVDLENPKKQFYDVCRVFYGAKIDEKALAINGFTKADVLDTAKKSEKELLESFLEWMQGASGKIIAGMNPSFDRDFLRAAAKRSELSLPFGYRTIDLHTLAYAHFLKKGIDLPKSDLGSGLHMDVILQNVGLQSREGPHNALEDARLSAEAIYRLLYGKGLLEEFSEMVLPKHLKKFSFF